MSQTYSKTYSNFSNFAWLNQDSRAFLSRGYLSKSESAEERIKDIANTAEQILDEEGFANKFYHYMSEGYYSLASPIWSNFGRLGGLPISCNGVYVGDEVSRIITAAAEVTMQTKYGAGTSGYFGNIRKRGSPIKSAIDTGGTADGPVHFLSIFENTTEAMLKALMQEANDGPVHWMSIFDNVTDVISQGNVRRGSFAAYLDITHPDVEEFLEIREVGNPLQKISIGLCIPDDWMNAMITEGEQVKAGTLDQAKASKLKLWARVIRKRRESGYPYLFFSDTVNNNKPQALKDKNVTIYASNLCMTGDQRVVTSRGYLTAKELYEQGGELTLFDGEDAVKSSPMLLREENADVYKITLSNGLQHKVTAYHGLPVQTGKGTYKRVAAQDLKVGDRIMIQKQKGLFGTHRAPQEAFLAGVWQSDGTQANGRLYIDLWENDFDLTDEINDAVEYVYAANSLNTRTLQMPNVGPVERHYDTPQLRDVTVSQSQVKKKRLDSKTLNEALQVRKAAVPTWIWSADEETQWSYVRGLLIADGTVTVNKSAGNPIQVAYADVNREFLEELQLLFLNLGLSAQIRLLRKAGQTMLPDGKGGSKLYDTQTCWRLIVSNKPDALEIERHTGFLSRKGVNLEDRAYRDNTKKAYDVVSIEYVGQEPVYCPTVDTREHVFIAQGMLTFNCSEICLPSSESESFVCDLSSMNLATWEAWKDTDAVEVLTRLLDAVMTEYIDKAGEVPFMGPSQTAAKRWRAIGIGQLGWHTYLQSESIPFDSLLAQNLSEHISKTINERALEASKELAERYGEPEGLEGYGVRNLTRTAIAPTTSSSFILGQVSPSIEPLHSNYFIKDLAKGQFSYRNPQLEAVLEAHGKNTEDTWKKILKANGSVQGLSFLSSEEKDVYKTFDEISPMAIVQQAAVRQKHLDQSQSLNLLIPPDANTKDVNALLIEGWRLGIKTFYYQRSSNPSQNLVRSILECAVCEG